MEAVLNDILEDLRSLYTIVDHLERFDAYVSLNSGTSRSGKKAHGEQLPLGTFSPMGERQADYLDCLIALEAEQLAQGTANEVTADFPTLPDRFRLMLVVADVPRNGWTQRQLTDAEWRFTLKNDAQLQSKPSAGFNSWVNVLLWTDTEPTETYVRRETRGALYRALHRHYVGEPSTLAEMMRQEGRVLSYAGYLPELVADELAYSREAIEPYLQNTGFSTCFAALYGDEAAKAAGYEGLGLAANAGFQLALYDAFSEPQADLLELHLDKLQHEKSAAPSSVRTTNEL